jgi:cytidylate kinase
LYGVHKEDLGNYDLVIDTTNLAPEQVAEMIYNEYINWYNK